MGERRLGPYRLAHLLGRGGMGEVHRAVDERKNRTVALKLLPAGYAADASFASRFRREAEVTAQLHEPHVIPIHDYGEIDGQLFLDMRYVAGTDLDSVVGRGPLSAARAVDLVGQTASALDAAHRAGLVHRDVKPSNILLTDPHPDDPDAAPDFVYLIDFGIAANVLDTRLTPTSTAVGTAAYMAPERFLPGPGGDGRVDVYALGCVLFELLTGRRLFAGDSFPQLMYAHLNLAPPRLSSVRPDLPAGLDDVVAASLHKDPEQRPARAGDLAVAARSALARSTSRPAPPRPATAPRLRGDAAAEDRAPSRTPTPPSGKGAPPRPPAPVAARSPDPRRRPPSEVPSRPRPGGARWWYLAYLALTVPMVLLLAAVAVVVYVHGQFYVATSGVHVAIYQGVPGSFLDIRLQEVVEDSGLDVADLTPVARTRLAGDGIPAEDLAGAQQIVARLRAEQLLLPCPSPSATSGTVEPVPGRDCRTTP